MRLRWARPAAWTIILLVTGFWLWFGIASAASEDLGAGNWVAHVVGPGAILLATAAIAWRWPVAGAALLVLEGLVVAVGYPLMVNDRFPLTTIVFVLLTMAAPPIVAGVLLLVGRRATAGS
jgi:hypothetical protein